MKNTNTPFIIVKLDTERKLRLSNKSLYILESTFGKKLHDIDFDALSVTELNQLIYSGLKSQDESITYDMVVDLIDDHMSYPEAVEVIARALEGSSFLSLKDSKQAEKPVEKQTEKK